MGLWRWVEEEGGGVVLCDHGEVGRWPPAQRQRACGAQTCFQVTETCSVFFFFKCWTNTAHLFFCCLAQLYCTSLHQWVFSSQKQAMLIFLWPQLRWSFSEGELELQNREGAVPAASLLRGWRYAWLLDSINTSSTKKSNSGLLRTDWRYCLKMTSGVDHVKK